MGVSIYLKSYVDKHGKSPLYCQYTYVGTKEAWPMNRKIERKYWDSKKREFKSSHPHSKALNMWLRDYLLRIDGIVLEIERDRKSPVAFRVKEKMMQPMNRDFNSYWNEFLKSLRHKSLSTIKNARLAGEYILLYEKKFGKVHPEAINQQFIEEFIELLKEEGKSNATVANYAGYVRQFVKHGAKKGWFELKQITIQAGKANSIKISLLLEEVEKLELVEPNSKLENQVKKMFLFQCYTGMRIGDMMQLRLSNIMDDRIYYIPQKTQKDGIEVTVPILSKTRVIIEEFRPDMFPSLKISDYNSVLKEISKRAGLDRAVTYKGKRSPLHEVITSHRGRNTFITIARKAGYSHEDIALIVGHRNIDRTRSYDTTEGHDIDLGELFG